MIRFDNSFEINLTLTLSTDIGLQFFYKPFVAVLFSISFITLISLIKWQKERKFNMIRKSFTEFFCENVVSKRFVNFHFTKFMFYFLFCYIIVTRNGKIENGLEMRAVLIEISVMLKFTGWPKTLGIVLKRHGFLWKESAICRWFSC